MDYPNNILNAVTRIIHCFIYYNIIITLILYAQNRYIRVAPGVLKKAALNVTLFNEPFVIYEQLYLIVYHMSSTGRTHLLKLLKVNTENREVIILPSDIE